jgi:hypothetical protein
VAVFAALGSETAFDVPGFEAEFSAPVLVEVFSGLAAATVFRSCRKYAMNVITTNADRKNFLMLRTKSDS